MKEARLSERIERGPDLLEVVQIKVDAGQPGDIRRVVPALRYAVGHLEDHLAERPTNRDVVDRIETLEIRGPVSDAVFWHEAFVVLLERALPVRFAVAVAMIVREPGYADAFVQHTDEPSRLEALHLQAGHVRASDLGVQDVLPRRSTVVLRSFFKLNKVVDSAELKDLVGAVPVL